MAHNLVLATFGAPRPHRDAGADVWLLEANHRIANNLSLVAGLLQLQAAETPPAAVLTGEQASALLTEAANRVTLVARLHRLLARAADDTRPDLTEFLREITEATASLLAGQGRTTLSFTGASPCPLAAERVLPIGLIVGELLTNSIKYAHPSGAPGVVRLSCDLLPDGSLRIEVSDDGVGLPEGLDPASATSLGMRLIRSLARQAEVALAFDQNGIGLSVTLDIPVDG